MKQFLSFVAVVALLVVPANANALRLFLAPEGVTGNDPLNGISPTLGNPVADGTGAPVTWYVWAQVIGDPADKYVSVGYNLRTTGTATVESAMTWNYTNILQRWAVANGGQLVGGELENVRLAANPSANFGVAGNSGTGGLDQQFDPGTMATVIGQVQVSGVGDLHLEIGDIGIIRTGATWDNVYLGFGDEGDGLMGDDKQMGSSIADATLTPEPASLLLLGLAGLALRRR